MGDLKRHISIYITICIVAILFIPYNKVMGQVKGDIINTFAKYIQNGDAEKLSIWFADNIEFDISGEQVESSKAQAKHILKDFFDLHKPQSFNILHKSGNPQMRYAIGIYKSVDENFKIILLVRTKNNSSLIVRIRIEKDN